MMVERREPALADTSFVVALGNHEDKYHQACAEVFRKQQMILLPQTVIAEVGYMLKRNAGIATLIAFLRQLPWMKYRVIPLEDVDFDRAADLLEMYSNINLDFVDATIVALAERLNISRILTLDRRDFDIIRPAHISHFQILP